ncbi:MAG: hypothetical protein HOI80_01070 [Alphaproteobacteria bacterium]|jgi:F-type H+-transporting ATPase subunit b|nr:hypothetical protein [Alphaproteobacteria bacterium]MBT5390651.1 hypothetical protein [Alphaproteobacteria bacterium]MBT5540253.1 hypothetical protein [Alphaproteobacteria bacterium]MBT5654077.1 hypothetical protein [Alphaproteobacteria bacterium]
MTVLSTPTFWVMVSFLLFIVFAGRHMWKIISKSLDDHSQKIKGQLEQATSLREEAQALLNQRRRDLAETNHHIDDILNNAKKESEILKDKSRGDIEHVFAHQEKSTLSRISQMEEQALLHLRKAAADIIVDASKDVFTTAIAGKKVDPLVEQTLKDFPKKISL